ncbi:uncharacterized protein LOC123562563 [Mercenaria mercenaria]|uniref:uncharacterized protein LOC123562563 n=1 Tax=Mercenaria mercenaria TaxID=6596 RepID=UPI00234F22FA|nr:uncharacterized protein LOC123562563 [Mercenaria mercenaria]XP_045211127.2 uncharacterized protein LOC123562563 [Mercenaria mercenaria]
MFTVVPTPEVKDHRDQRAASGEPVPQIIDHRHRTQPRENWLDGRKSKQETYESIKAQRDNLVQSEFKYKKMIKELEKEKEDLLKVYEPTYNENERLKSHLLHGPGAQKIKKLKQEKRELMSELEIVKEENVEITDRVKELEKMFLSEKDYYLEKKWREAIERGRKRREEKDAGISTQGPLTNARKPKKRDLKTVKDEEFEKQDVYDLHIDNLEKETQILLNKIRQLKQNKENINYANFIGKGAVTRNAAIANAINEKLERDLETFEERLENLRKKTGKLTSDTAEEIVITEKKSKPKQTGTKYFRTKPTQTDALPEQNELEKKSNETKEQNVSNGKSVLRSTNRSGKEINKRTSLTKVSTPTDDDLLEAPDYSTNKKHHRIVSKKFKQDSDGGNSETVHAIWNVSRTSNENKGYTSPIAEHWANLAVKLNETEKYGKKKPFTHRNKVFRYKGNQHTPSRQIQLVSEDENQETEESERNSAKSQRSILSVSSQSSLEVNSQNKYIYDIPRHVEQKPARDVKLKADENSNKNADTVYKTSRKTTNTGEVIRYIPRQYSWEMTSRVKYSGDQMGRYSNGPEPIGRHRKQKQDVNTSREFRLENENSQSNLRSTVNKPSEVRSERKVSRDIKLRQRATPSDDEFLETRNTSAYDEVLADIRKKYKDQAQKQTIES